MDEHKEEGAGGVDEKKLVTFMDFLNAVGSILSFGMLVVVGVLCLIKAVCLVMAKQSGDMTFLFCAVAFMALYTAYRSL